jgi:hypothetical protein
LRELIHGEAAAKDQKIYYTAMVENMRLQEETSRQAFETAFKDYEYMMQEANKNVFSDEQKEEIKTKLLEATTAYTEAIIETSNWLKDQYLNEVDSMLDDFVNRLTDGFDLEKVKEEWDWLTSQDEKYLDSVNAAFEVRKLENQFAKAANATNNLKTQERINALREQELAILKSKDKLSQYDIDRAKKRLEILQAEIALQDAQDAKTQMRLMRNADGTYSY